jgi:hypothetical protein
VPAETAIHIQKAHVKASWGFDTDARVQWQSVVWGSQGLRIWNREVWRTQGMMPQATRAPPG